MCIVRPCQHKSEPRLTVGQANLLRLFTAYGVIKDEDFVTPEAPSAPDHLLELRHLRQSENCW